MFPRTGRRSSLSPRVTRWAAAGAGLLVASTVVVQSSAAFTSTTTRPDNRWAAGNVIVTAANAGTAMFNESNLKPGSSGEQCVVVTYSGSLAAEVRLHAAINTGASPLSNGLETYLNATVVRAAGDQSADCAGLGGVTPIDVYSGTMNGLATTHNNYTNGATAGGWQPTPPSTTMVMTYRFQWSLQDNNSAQGLRANITISWEAQNT
jgi:hypothetical protein